MTNLEEAMEYLSVAENEKFFHEIQTKYLIQAVKALILSVIEEKEKIEKLESEL